jgi:methylmalonyl-CoA/ethylmalonyl-CoA epimerase
MEHIGAMLGGRLFQIGIVVSDLDESLRRSAEIFGHGEKPWRCYSFGGTGRHSRAYRGAPTSLALRLALNDASPQLELIQPLDADSPHGEWLAEHGEGLHHIGFIVPSVEQAVTAMAALGCPVILAGEAFGAAGDGTYAYFDSANSLGVIVEAVEPPKSGLPPPDAIWPAG